ncbi:MAG: hypothetical protein AB1757_11210 [Acidobacteriota bacterium]
MTENNRGIFAPLIGDGRPLLWFTGLMLMLSGIGAIFIAATGHFLPQDVQYLGMTASELCQLHQCRIVHFMIHDRVSWGGSLVAIGSLYMWMVSFPLKRQAAWSWWVFLITGILGFGSFLAYLGYGYLDSWHGVATLALLPIFLTGLLRSRATLPRDEMFKTIFKPAIKINVKTREGMGRLLLLFTGLGMIAAGATILIVGMTAVFVPQDLSFMKVTAEELRAINERLVPLIAHDRAGFGGGICTTGLAVLFCVWCGKSSRNLWQVLCLAGTVGFATAIGIHPIVGYNDFVHLAPAMIGAITFLVGITLCYKPMVIERHQ